MNWKRIATLGVMGGTLVTLLARASTSVAPAAMPVPAGPLTTPAAPVFPEVERLRARLRAPIVPAAPTRNLFAFKRVERKFPASPAAPAPPATPAATAVAAAAPVPRTPGLTFVGLAEDPGPDGPVRTAILSGGRDLHFAKTGDAIGAYRVAAIGADALELIAVDDGASFVLTLK